MEGRSYRERLKVVTVRARVGLLSRRTGFCGDQAEGPCSPGLLLHFDEAHRLRNVYKGTPSSEAKRLKQSLQEPFKVLLTATPLQNNIMELFGLVSIIDDKVFGDESELSCALLAPTPNSSSCVAPGARSSTLRRNVQEAGHINYTRPHRHDLSVRPPSVGN